MKLFFLLIFLFSARPSLALNFPETELLSLDPYWQTLLYYKKNGPKFEGMVSVDGFYLDKEGKTSPSKELLTNLNIFKEKRINQKFKIPYACQFPERYKFLKKHFPNALNEVPDCPDLQAWKKSLISDSISLVFSSAYTNNPSSMFGHTFLKFNHFDPENLARDFQNYTATFGALYEQNESTILVSLKGIFGFYLGFYALDPFYIRVREYISSESRDLWDYELNVSKEQIDSLINHLWELYTSARFNYYFFDENCSYYISKLIDLIIPELRETPYRPYVIPSDVVKRVTNVKNLVKKIRFRPSSKKILDLHYNNLTPSQKDLFWKALDKNNPQILDTPALLNTAIKYLDYKKNQNSGQLNPNEMSFLQAGLRNLSQMETQKEELTMDPFEMNNQPSLSHPVSRMGVAYKNGDDQQYSFFIKAGYHDFMDSDEGLERFNQIDILRGEISYSKRDKKIYIQEFTPVQVRSFPDYSKISPKFSWSINASFLPLYERNQIQNHKFEIPVSGGLAKRISHPTLLGFLLIGVRPEFSKHYDEWARIGSFLNIGLYQNIKKFKWGLEATYNQVLLKGNLSKEFYTIIENHYSYSFNNESQIRISLDWRPLYGTWDKAEVSEKIGLYYYF